MSARTPGPLTVDPCSDSRNFYTVRFADGSEHGDTTREPVATFYTPLHVARKIVEACNAYDTLRADNARLLDMIEEVCISDEQLKPEYRMPECLRDKLESTLTTARERDGRIEAKR